MATNKKPKKNWNLGNRCFWCEPITNDIHAATIVALWEDTAKIVDGDFNVRIGVPLDSLFEHMSDAMWALKEQNGPAIKEYYDSIETTNDLVRFGYEHAISPDAQAHTDWFAREAYRIKARELCGLEL